MSPGLRHWGLRAPPPKPMTDVAGADHPFPFVPQRPCCAPYLLRTLGRSRRCPWCPVGSFCPSTHPLTSGEFISCPLQLVSFCSFMSLSLGFLDLAADGAGIGGAGTPPHSADCRVELLPVNTEVTSLPLRGRILEKQPHSLFTAPPHRWVDTRTSSCRLTRQLCARRHGVSHGHPHGCSHGHMGTASHPRSEPPVHTHAWMPWLTCSRGADSPCRTTRLTQTRDTEL